ncbi:hypothetical protein [Rothia sp. 88186D007BW]
MKQIAFVGAGAAALMLVPTITSGAYASTQIAIDQHYEEQIIQELDELEQDSLENKFVVEEENKVQLTTFDGISSLSLPGTDVGQTVDSAQLPKELFSGIGEPVLNTSSQGATISTYETSRGHQTLISIPDSSAAKDYRFEIGVPDGGRVLQKEDGSIDILSSSDEVVMSYASPWALDSVGNKVPTHYTVEGNALIQTIEFTEDTAFPVVADSEGFWGWAECVGVLGVEVLPLFVPGGKLAVAGVKIAAKFGSVKKGVEFIVRSRKAFNGWDAYMAHLKKTYGNVFADVLGITAVRHACFS